MSKLNLFFLLLVFPLGLNAQVRILFNATKAETAGSADWVIDADLHNIGYTNGPPVVGQGSESNPQQLPTPLQSTVTSSSPETYWNGGISAWGIDLVKKGYIVETLPYNGAITYGIASNPQDLSNYKVFIDCEPNILYTAAEKTAIMHFVQNGGGLFMVSDHTVSDRNNDGSDSPVIWNDLMTNNGILANPFGITFDLANFSQTTTNIPVLPADPILHGIMGNVTSVMWSNGTSMTLNTTANSSVTGIIYKTGSAFGNSNVMFAYASYGTGKVAAIGDSSPCDDGTGDSGDVLYNGWTADAGGNHERLIINATLWLASSSQALPAVTTLAAAPVASASATLNGSVNPNGAATTAHFEWGTTTSYGNSTPVASAGSGSSAINVSAGISGLTTGTTCHFRIAAVNVAGTSYGTDLTFIPGSAQLATTAISSITMTGAISGGSITSDGGNAITARGVCWNTSASPTIANNHTSDGSGIGSFTSSLSGLASSTVYHVRAYATNTGGTWYGEDLSFTTSCGTFILPFSESFTTAALPGCWAQIDHQGNGELWAFGTITGYSPLPALTGNYAFLNSDGYGSGNSQNADLVTPSLDLSGYVAANLAFKHYFRYYAGSSGTVSYSINDGLSWTSIATFNTASTSNPASFSQAVNAVAGQPNVKFKWNFIGTWGHYWGIDDVQITGTPCTTLPVSVTIAATANPFCADSLVTLNATPVNGGISPAFLWKVNGVSAGTNSASFTYVPANNDAVTCTVTSSANCTSGNPAISNQVLMSSFLIIPTITGSSSACLGNPAETYITEPGMTGYAWGVTAGGEIISGIGTNSISVIWNAAGPQTIAVTYRNSSGCSAPVPAVFHVNVNALPGPAGAISGPANVCAGTQGVIYSVDSIPDATNYLWTIPVGATIAAGPGTRTITVNFSDSAFTGEFLVRGTGICSDGLQSPVLPVSSNPLLTGRISITNQIIPSASLECHAAQSITTADSGTLFTIAAGGGATLIASEYIRLLPGTSVQETGMLHAFITNECIPCSLLNLHGSSASPVIASWTGDIPANQREPSSISIYPNPTSGSFTLEVAGMEGSGKVHMEIYSSRGECLKSEELTGELRHVYSLSGRLAGVYFIRVTAGAKVETFKLIRY